MSDFNMDIERARMSARNASPEAKLNRKVVDLERRVAALELAAKEKPKAEPKPKAAPRKKKVTTEE